MGEMRDEGGIGVIEIECSPCLGEFHACFDGHGLLSNGVRLRVGLMWC